MDEKNYLRVTEILAPFTGVEFVPDHILSPAAERGTFVHSMIEDFFHNVSPPGSDEELSYFDCFKKWWNGYAHNFKDGEIQTERRLYCDKLGITGQIDLVVSFPYRTYLVDWKTSSQFQRHWYLQGAAYRYLCEENGLFHVDDVLFVKLCKGKKATMYKSKDYEENLNIFKKCVELYKFFKMDKTRRVR